MDTVSNIKIRRSIRKYKEDAIPHSLIEEVVETARFAPSWKNAQIGSIRVRGRPGAETTDCRLLYNGICT